MIRISQKPPERFASVAVRSTASWKNTALVAKAGIDVQPCRHIDEKSFMQHYVIIELDDGLTIVEVKPHQSPEDVALRAGGTLIDPGPYASYDEAVDALADLETDDERD
jgi:hypothetical protein